MNKEHYSKLKPIIAQYLPDDVASEAIQINSNFITELNINSANLVDIVLDVEDAFDILLENDDMDGMQTVQDALDIINQKLGAKK